MNFGKILLSDDIKKKLSADIGGGSLSHAILITGKDEALRKKLTLRIASALLCSGEKERPCEKCPACIKTKALTHPDLIITEGSDKQKSIKIDRVRELRQMAYILPNEAEFKIFLILEASGMGEEAQNALLKIMEEPPPFTRFILACASRDSLLPTVRSRVSEYFTGEADAERSTAKTEEKIASVIQNIAECLTSSSEFDLIISIGALEKDKSLFKKTVDELILVFRDALLGEGARALSANSSASKKIAEIYSQKELLPAINKLKNLREDADKNANENLLLTRLCCLLQK